MVDHKSWSNQIQLKGLEERRGDGEDSIGIDGVLYESEWTYYVNLHYVVDILINNIIREGSYRLSRMQTYCLR